MQVKHLAWVSSKAIVAFYDSLILIPLETVAGDSGEQQQQQQQQQSQFEIYYSEPIYLVGWLKFLTSSKVVEVLICIYIYKLGKVDRLKIFTG